jgi:hypothetical protein
VAGGARVKTTVNKFDPVAYMILVKNFNFGFDLCCRCNCTLCYVIYKVLKASQLRNINGTLKDPFISQLEYSWVENEIENDAIHE